MSTDTMNKKINDDAWWIATRYIFTALLAFAAGTVVACMTQPAERKATSLQRAAESLMPPTKAVDADARLSRNTEGGYRLTVHGTGEGKVGVVITFPSLPEPELGKSAPVERCRMRAYFLPPGSSVLPTRAPGSSPGAEK